MSSDAWDGLDAPTVRAAIGEIARIESRLSAHKAAAARVLDASGAAKRAGATSTGDLLARDYGGDRAAGDRLVRTAKRLQQSTATNQALSSGEVSF
ncbi:hypothetical protein ACHAAC_17475, partial [Aeromicrobium sp. CF4.19]|uniref:hypothetical protein n=1 Tax=Aeromicrobium sp. CF4.19 TaxID=3373082 RepID=UPI003EE6867F